MTFPVVTGYFRPAFVARFKRGALPPVASFAFNFTNITNCTNISSISISISIRISIRISVSVRSAGIRLRIIIKMVDGIVSAHEV